MNEFNRNLSWFGFLFVDVVRVELSVVKLDFYENKKYYIGNI